MQGQPIPKGLCQCGCGGRTTLARDNDADRGLVKGEPMRFLRGHNRRGAKVGTEETRFWAKVEKEGHDGCWVWTGALSAARSNAYGCFRIDGASVRAHRWAYEHFVGPIPDGLTIDHLCRNTRCVNPAHLEAVTQRENNLRGIGPPAVNARKTHCVRGHPLSGDNVRIWGGARWCRECRRENKR